MKNECTRAVTFDNFWQNENENAPLFLALKMCMMQLNRISRNFKDIEETHISKVIGGREGGGGNEGEGGRRRDAGARFEACGGDVHKEDAQQLKQDVLKRLTVLEKHCEEAAKRKQEEVQQQHEAAVKEERSRQQEAARKIAAEQAATVQAAADKVEIMQAIRELAHDVRQQHISITKHVLTPGHQMGLQSQRLFGSEAVRDSAPASKPLNGRVFGDNINRGSVEEGRGGAAQQASPLRSGLLPPVDLVLSHRPIAHLYFPVSAQRDDSGHKISASDATHAEAESGGERAQAQIQSLRQRYGLVSATSPMSSLGPNKGA